MASGTSEKSLKQESINVGNYENKNAIDANYEIRYWTRIQNHNVNKMKRSENSTHVTGKNSCIETDFKREMRRYYVSLKQNLNKINRIQEEAAIKMNRLYKESRKLARRSRNEKKQSLKSYRKHSSKFRGKRNSTRGTEEEENEEPPPQQQQQDLEQTLKDEVLHNQNNETITLETKLTNQSSVLSPFLPVIYPNEVVSLTSKRNTSESTLNESEFKQGQINTELIKPNISSWLETINEGKDDPNDQESVKPSKLDTSRSIQHPLRRKYSICEKNQTRQSIAYSIIRHRENQLRNLKAALSEAPIAYLWNDNLNKSTTKLKTKFICSKYKDINLQAKRCIPGSIGGLSNYFLEIIALPKPALIRFPPPTSMHQYIHKKILAKEKQQMQQNLNRLTHLTEEMKRVSEGQKLMAALKFLLASTSNEKNENIKSEGIRN
ncbi:unnamed protein product [Schistosoma haematobium]|nr:unnamed protein product [Schistosoma haematobium]